VGLRVQVAKVFSLFLVFWGSLVWFYACRAQGLFLHFSLVAAPPGMRSVVHPALSKIAYYKACCDVVTLYHLSVCLLAAAAA
jgi:cyanate permease